MAQQILPSTDPLSQGTVCALAGRSVLIVEDSEIFARFLREIVTLAGARPTVLGTVAAALGALRDGTSYDLAVVDLTLLGSDGLPVADRLTQCRIPFLFSSGHDPMTLPSRYRGAPYLTKPVSAREVLEALARLVDADSRAATVKEVACSNRR